MADEQNIFDQIGTPAETPPPPAAPAEPNPFDEIGPKAELTGDTSKTGAFMRGAERSVAPALGGLVAMGAGAELGAAGGALIGGPLAPITAPIGGVVGGVAGMLLGSTAISAAQDWALSKLPDSWREKIGMDDRQQRLDETEHSTASFLGGLTPFALTMRPGGFARGALPENSTALQRILAHPATARVFGGTVMGGLELGTEVYHGDAPDWTKVGIATGFGVIWNKPTKLGQSITEFGAGPTRAAIGIEARPPPTVAQAGDLKVMGPGITEEVFQGSHAQAQEAADTARSTAQSERTLTTPAELPALHDTARRLEPELFEHYDALAQRREEFRNWLDEHTNPPDEHVQEASTKVADLERQLSEHVEGQKGYTGGAEARRMRAQLRDAEAQRDMLLTRRANYIEGRPEESPEAAQARQHLLAVDYEMRDLAPEVSAAYRRAAEWTGGETVPAPAAAPPQAEAAAPAAAEAPRAEPAPGATGEAAPAALKPIAEQKAAIAADVVRQLVAAGRPQAEAEAAGQLIAARYATRAARFGGARGTAEELYQAEGAEIRGGGTSSARRGVEPASTPSSESAPIVTKPETVALAAHALPKGYEGWTPGATVKVGPVAGMTVVSEEGGRFILQKGSKTYSFDPPAKVGREKTGLEMLEGLRELQGAELAQSKEFDQAFRPRAFIEFGRKLADAIAGRLKPGEHIGMGATPEALVKVGVPELPLVMRASVAKKATVAKHAVPMATLERLPDLMRRPLAVFESSERPGEWVVALNEADANGNPIIAAVHGGDGKVVTINRVASVYGKDRRTWFTEQTEAGRLLYLDEGDRQRLGASRVQFPDAPSLRGVAPADGKKIVTDADLVKELDQSARGKIRLAEGRRPIVTLMRDANASTFIHETGHDFLEQLMRDADHPQAPNVLKDDALTVRDWLGVNERSEIKTRHHEKFARGFEQYMREGVAPSKELAGVFAKFKDWLVSIYQTIKGLGQPINEDIRQVFDRLLAEEPNRTVIGPEHARGPMIADIHEADAAHTEPAEAPAVADRVANERARTVEEPPARVAHEIEAERAKVESETGAELGAEDGGGAGGPDEVVQDRGEPGPVARGGGVGEGNRPVGGGGGEAAGEGEGVSRPEQRRGTGPDAGPPLAPAPATLLGADQSPFVDKAGNIRVENLTTREDVAQAIRDAADRNNDFVGDRRGVITDGQAMELADALGMDFQQLNVRKLGQAFNAEQILAARKLLIQSATEVAATMKKAATGTDEDVLAYAMSKDRHQMIQGQVAGITAEAGRALRAFRSLAGEEGAQNVDQFIRGATGKTLFQLRREAVIGAQLDTPGKVSKFMQDAKKRTFGRMILEYWINGLISGPATHTTYMMGNTLLALEKAGPETAAAAAIGALRKAMGREGETVRLGEVAAQLKGGAQGVAPAVKAAIDSLRTGVTTLLPGETMRSNVTMPFQPGTELVTPATLDEAAKFSDALGSAFGLVRGLRDGVIAQGALLKAGGIEGSPLVGANFSQLGAIPDLAIRGATVLPVGTALRLPSRFIAAIHSFFRSVNYSMEKAGGAYRIAANEGLEGNAFDARLGQLRENPTEEQMADYRHEATELTLMGQGSKFTQALGRLTNTEMFGFPILKFIDPFVHISSNVIEQSIIRRSPIGLLSPEIRADLAGKNGTVAQDKAQARMLVGTALGLTFGSLAAEGFASGSGPSDPREAAMWRQAGNQAHSVRIGDIWYDTHRLGPLGMLMGIGADMYEVAHAAEKSEFLKAASHLQHAITQNVLDESFMRGPSELIRAIEDPGRYGEAYIRNFLSSFVPYSVGLAQVNRAIDPYSRQARTVVDAMKAKVPGLSQELLPRRDVWGEMIPNRDALIAAGVTAIYETHVGHDPVNQAMLDLGVFPARLDRKIRNVELTDQQYDYFSMVAGRMTKMRLDAIVKSPDWQTWPAHIKHDVIQETIRQSREAARGMMMARDPTIVQRATAAKLEKIHGKE